MKILFSISILSPLFLIFACANFIFSANWVDTYVVRQLDYYFDTSSLQSQLLKDSLKNDVENVRKLIYPKISSELTLIEKDISKVKIFNGEKIASYGSRLRKTFEQALIILEPSAQNFVNHLNSSQIELFRNEFDRKTKDLEEEVEPPFEAKSRRFTKVIKQLEDWIGELQSEQKKDIQKFCESNIFPIKEQVLNRNNLSREFLKYFPDKEKRKNFIHQLFYDYDSIREPSYTKALKEDQQKYFELISVVLNKMTAKQRKHLSETLKKRAEEIGKSSEKKALVQKLE